MKNLINVVFTIDRNYTTHFAVALTSLLENNRDLIGRVFLVNDHGMDDELRKLQTHFQSRYGITFELLTLDASVLAHIKILHHLSKATTFRLLLDRIIPGDIDTVLLLDSDLIVIGDLSELLRIDFSGEGEARHKLIYAVDHKVDPASLERLRDTNFKSDNYFNAGVLYIDLRKWRELSMSDKFIDITTRYPDCLSMMDQDVLNIALENRWGVLDFKYNGFGLRDTGDKDIRVVHFTGPTKPWHLRSKHPYKKTYWKYRAMTPYKTLLPDDFGIRSILSVVTPLPLRQAFYNTRQKFKTNR